MKIAYKALWIIESRKHEPLSLDAIAGELGVSGFHLARAFAATVGMPLMQYVRRRRLTEAARQLVGSERRVLDVAVDAGYGSQEAFARAFSAEFGAPPQTFRQKRLHETAHYLEALLVESDKTVALQQPGTETLPAMRLVGLARHYDAQSSAGIPEQWSRFNELGLYDGRGAAYGVCYNADGDGNMDYLSGVAVESFAGTPSKLDRLTLPAQTYAVFRHDGHISEMRDVWMAIWNHGLVDAGLAVSEGPSFELYGEEFDPQSGNGGYEIWVPVQAPARG